MKTKKLFLLSSLALVVSLFVAFSSSNSSDKVVENSKTSQKKMPVMTFEKTEHNFGTIESGTPVEVEFTFTNTGNAPLVITDAKSTCGCTVPEKPTEPVMPGEEGLIKVNYNGSGAGKVTKYVTITANTEAGTEIVKILGNVTKPTTTENAK